MHLPPKELCRTDTQRTHWEAVKDNGGVRAAAEKLGISHAAISRTISRVRSYSETDDLSKEEKPKSSLPIFHTTPSYTRFSFVTDSHGDMCDWAIWRKYMEFQEQWRPHLKIHGGDALDLRPYRTGASRDEQMERIVEDMVAFRRLWEEYQPDVWLQGNHDDRLREHSMSDHNPDRAILCQKYIEEINELCTTVRCDKILPYHVRTGKFQLGNVGFLHGYKTGVNCARAMGQTYGSCIFGHTHTYQRVTIPTLENIVAISSPIIGKIDMPYLSRQIGQLQHRNGWTYGVVNEKTGAWEAWSTVFDEQGNYIDPFQAFPKN